MSLKPFCFEPTVEDIDNRIYEALRVNPIQTINYVGRTAVRGGVAGLKNGNFPDGLAHIMAWWPDHFIIDFIYKISKCINNPRMSIRKHRPSGLKLQNILPFTSGLDLHKCVQMVKASLNELEKIQRNINNTIQVSDLFIIEMNDEIQKRIDESSEDLEIEKIQSKFEVKRMAKKRKMASYESNDEPIEEEEKKFTIEVYNRVLDTIIESMNKRFSNNNDLLIDLSLLSPSNFNLLKSEFSTDSLT
ncbi:hypothetical protein ACI65C_013528 [Semiaphis heraclei]